MPRLGPIVEVAAQFNALLDQLVQDEDGVDLIIAWLLTAAGRGDEYTTVGGKLAWASDHLRERGLDTILRWLAAERN